MKNSIRRNVESGRRCKGDMYGPFQRDTRYVMFPDEKQAAFRCINTRKGLKYQQHGEEER